MKELILLLFAAFGFWFVLFSPLAAGLVSFWPMMTLAVGLLAAEALILDRKRLHAIYRFQWRHIPVGILSAAVLYAVFFVGRWISVRILPFAAGQINSIYAIRQDHASWKLALLLFFWIGPAEEIFWRGFIQRRLSEKFNPLWGWIIAAGFYALVHVWSLNLMLIAAAAICGAFWGLLFWKTRSLWPVMISHAVWDVIIFIYLPIG